MSSEDQQEVDALAEMDIDAELAEIEELSDLPDHDEVEPSTEELHGVRFGPEEEAERSPSDEPGAPAADRTREIPGDLREEIRSVLHYMDQLLEALPEEKIQEFAESEHFEVYKRLFEELGIEQ